MKRYALPMAILCTALVTRSWGAATQPAPATQPLTADPRVQAFVHQIESEVAAGDTANFRKAFDVSALLSRVLGNLDPPPALRRGFESGLNSGLDQMMVELSENAKAGGKYTFLHLHIVKGELRAMFRLTGKTSFNYHDLVLRVDPGNTVRIMDMQPAATGELMSETYHRLDVPLVAEANKGIIARLTEGESDYVKNIGKVKALDQKFIARDYAGAHAIYEGLPASLQKEQLLMLYDLSCLSHIDRMQFADAMDRYEKVFPDSSSLSLLRIASTTQAKDWPGLLAAVNKLDQQVGGDPYLNVYRVTALQELGRGAEALAAGEKALKADPSCTDAYIALLHVLAAQRNSAGTAEMMQRMLTNTGKFLATMTTDPQFSEFIQTPEFAKFRSDHPTLKFHQPN